MRKILKGHRFRCIKDVIMIGSKDGEVAYVKGKEYVSDADGRITDEQQNIAHWWCDTETMETSAELLLYFIGADEQPITESVLYEDIETAEIVINTEQVQYRVWGGTVNCMLIGGHKFELTLDTLAKINNAVKVTNQ